MDASDWLGTSVVIVGILGTLATVFAQLLKSIREHPPRGEQRMATMAEATEQIGSAYHQLIQAQTEEMARYRSEVTALRAELGYEESKREELQEKQDKQEREIRSLKRLMTEYRKGINILVAQLRELGHEPAWEPSDVST